MTIVQICKAWEVASRCLALSMTVVLLMVKVTWVSAQSSVSLPMSAWNLQQIQATHRTTNSSFELSLPATQRSRLNNTVAIIKPPQQVMIIDTLDQQSVHHFKTPHQLHGAPVYSLSRRYLYFSSPDGWVSMFDMLRFMWVAEIRTGTEIRNLSLSGDGRYVMVANHLPQTLVVLNAETLTPLEVIPVIGENDEHSRVNAVYTAASRDSFIVALADTPEVWEINYAREPPLGFGQWAHDYREDSTELDKSLGLPIRKLRTKTILSDLVFNPHDVQLMGLAGDGQGRVLDLDLGRTVQSLQLSGDPQLSAGARWSYQKTLILAAPNSSQRHISFIDTQRWQIIKQLETRGPGSFIRSHDQSSYAWANISSGANRDLLLVIDKQTLKIIRTLKPVPGKVVTQVEFSGDAAYALVSVPQADGVVIIYDGKTLDEIKRVSLNQPLL